MAVTCTLAGNDLNDGTTYRLAADPVIEPLRVSWSEVTNYSDASSQQVNVKTKGISTVALQILVASTTAAGLVTALDTLAAYALAGGALVITADGETVLSCTVGTSQPPTRVLDGGYLLTFQTLVVLELVRLN